MNGRLRTARRGSALLRARLYSSLQSPTRAQKTATRPARPSAFALVPAAAYPRAAISPLSASFHSPGRARKRVPGPQDSSATDGPRTTDFGSLDIFGDTPVPSTSVDVCLPNGFRLNNGVLVSNGSGMLLVGGEAFAWRPWGRHTTLLNAKGQWEVGSNAFGLLGLVWPRPDLLILGLGPEMRPLSPETKRCITALGMRVEVLDTRNAASQFNLLATERGVDDVAAALVPIGWNDGWRT